MAAEAFGWPEGLLYFYTGVTAQSGNPIAYVENSNGNLQWGWQWDKSLSGTYRPHLIDRTVDASFNARYTFETTTTVQRLVNLETAMHIKLLHSSINGTGGLFLFSGRVAGFSVGGNAGDTYMYTISYQAHQWSAF